MTCCRSELRCGVRFQEEQMKTVCTVIAAIALAAPAAAQTGSAMREALKKQFDFVKGNITKSAEKVPEDLYAYKPVDTVRTFGQIVGHLADANHMFCGVASGEKAPAESIEKTKTTKADLQ